MPAPPRTCILSVARGAWYPLGQRRLIASLRTHGVEADVLAWTDEDPPGSPPHDRAPYAFKVFAFLEAQRRGYERAIWMDASLIVLRPLGPILRWMDEHGSYLALHRSHLVGAWTSDAALGALGMDREEAMGLHSVDACLMGLDLREARSRRFLEAWRERAEDGVSFPGAWSNERGEVSADPRVLGHRHDQSVASVLAHRLGLPRRRWSHNFVRHGNDYRWRERALVQCRRACEPGELRGRVGSRAWRWRRVLDGC